MPIGSPINNFQGFALAEDANVQAQSDYLSSTERQKGMQTGPADSAKCNKIWRQGANMAAAMGAVMNARGFDAVDDGDVNELYHNLFSALAVTPCYNAVTFDYLEGTIVQQNSGWALWQGPLELYVCIQRTGPSYGGTAPLTDTTHWQPITIGGGGGGGDGLESYSATKDYTAGAVVLYNGGLYIAVAANGPATTVAAPTNTAYWTEFLTAADFAAMGFTGITTYSATVDYTAGAVVTHNGELFFCVQANGPSSTVIQPAIGQNAAYWAPLFHEVATTSKAGFMSAADKEKLDGLYGVFLYDSTKSYTPGMAVTYSGGVYVCTRANGPSSPKAPTNATYWAPAAAIMTGATSSAAGVAGMVPAPGAGDNKSFLRGDGQWINPAAILPPPNIPMYLMTDDYVLNDIVTSNGNIYLCIQDNGPGTSEGVHTLNEVDYWLPFCPGDPIVDITISGTTMTLIHASGSTATRTLPSTSYPNADTTNY